MYDRGEFYGGCICKNGKVHPDCDRHQPITLDHIKARAEVLEILKKREEEK